MSSLPSPSLSNPNLPSTSTNTQSNTNQFKQPQTITNKDYGDIPKIPRPLPFERIDTHSIKQKLHDVLGEDGLPYWKALNGYLLGQLGRGELEGMVKSWFKGDQLELHNTLLLSLLNNASIPPTLYTPIISSITYNKKRKRVSYDDDEYDIDDESIQNKLRVQNWILGLNSRERSRIRRSILGKSNPNNAVNGGEGEVDLEDELNGLNGGSGSGLGGGAGGGGRRYSAWGNSNPSLPPITPTRTLPTANQLSLRLSQYAQAHKLSLAPDTSGEIGEFLSVGLENHLEDILHSIIHLTGSNRPGIGTIRIPGTSSSQDSNHVNSNLPNGILGGNKTKDQLPKTDLDTLNHLLTLNPNLMPIISPTLYKLKSGQIISTQPPNDISTNEQSNLELKNEDNTQSPFKTNSIKGINQIKDNKDNKLENITNNLVNSGLLKLDKAGGTNDQDNVNTMKKEKKHNLHWKYEDPAIILRDILG